MTSHGGDARRNEALLRRPRSGLPSSASASWASCCPGPGSPAFPANVTVQPSDTAGFRGYVKGSESAPVEITEYADYQCPFCQTFATLQMPTIEERLIRTGRLRWRYRDFPLQQHPVRPAGGPCRRLRRRAGEVLAAARPDLRGPGRVVGGRRRRRPTSGTTPGPSVWIWGATTSAWQSGKFAGRIQASVRGRCPGRGRLDADAAGRRPAVSGADRFGRDPAAGGFPGARRPMSHEDAAERGIRLSVVRPSKAAAHGQGAGRRSPSPRSGVVYGDIGTSPLYAIKECFSGHHSIDPTPGERDRRSLADLLVAQLHRLLQVHHVRPPGRQPGRGRHASPCWRRCGR